MATTPSTQVAKVSVALSPVEIKIVRGLEKRLGLNNFSASLRIVIREWEQQQKANGNRAKKAESAGGGLLEE